MHLLLERARTPLLIDFPSSDLFHIFPPPSSREHIPSPQPHNSLKSSKNSSPAIFDDLLILCDIDDWMEIFKIRIELS